MTRTDRFMPVLDHLGLGMTLLLPVFLTHGRIFSEITMDLLALGLLARSALGLGWGWARQFWVRLALLWWGWQIVCSLPHIGLGSSQALTQAVLAIRFPLMAVALQVWTLSTGKARRAMASVLVACCLYFVLQFVVQAVFGHNLFGYPRYIDGTLTGPYAHPRAAAPFSRLVLPVMMLGCAWLVAHAGKSGVTADRTARLRGFLAMSVLAIGVVAVMVLAGQRIPMALTVLGMAVCALFYRPLRPAALAALCSCRYWCFSRGFSRHRLFITLSFWRRSSSPISGSRITVWFSPERLSWHRPTLLPDLVMMHSATPARIRPISMVCPGSARRRTAAAQAYACSMHIITTCRL